MNLRVLVPMGIGLVLGCVCFLVIIRLLLKHFYMQTYYSIIGFTLGSVLVLYSPISFNLVGIASILCFIIGFKLAGRLSG